MNRKRLTLLCRVVGRPVEVVLIENPNAPRRLGVPEGWEVQNCQDKDTECFGKECPFTMDGGEWPFLE